MLSRFNNLARKNSLNISKQFVSTNIIKINNDNNNNKQINTFEYGKKQFLLKTSMYTGAGIVGTFAISAGLPAEITSLDTECLITGFAMTISSIAGLYFCDKPSVEYKKHPDSKNNNETYPVINNSLAQQISYATLVSGMSLTIAPIMNILDFEEIVLPAIISSSAIFSSSCAFGYYYSETAGKFKNIAGIGLLSLVGTGLLGLGFEHFIGPSAFTNALHNYNTYAGIPIFTLISAYDVHTALEMYKNKQPDAIMCSSNLYLNFINILVRMMEIIAKSKRH